MSWSRRIPLIAFLVLLIALLLAWGLIYGFADRALEISPPKGALLNDSSFDLSISWPYAVGGKIRSYRIFLDGEDVTDFVEKTSDGLTEGLTYSPSRWPEGGHVLQAELTYWWGFKRRISVRSHFSTDTVPPKINFARSSGMIALPRSWIHDLQGSTEAGSTLAIRLNGKAIIAPDVDETGHFSLSLYQLKDRNELKVTATDEAGNRNSYSIRVVIDRTAPIIAEISPADGKIVHNQNVTIIARIEEGDSEIENAVLRIDEKQAYGEFDPEEKEFVYSSNGFGQGEHQAELEVTDAAGNLATKKWSFSIDTTKLVLSLSQRKIFLYRNGELLKTYPCAVGRAGFATPKGHWRVVGKRKNPAWYNPRSPWSANMPAIIPPGPSNPLGTRAIELNAPAIRIHGTPNPSSVGRAVSHGCIRMYRNDVEELFDEVTMGVPVAIVD